MSSLPGNSEANFTIQTPGELLRKSLVVYSLMTLVGLTIMRFGHKNLATAFQLSNNWTAVARLVLIGGIGAGVLLIASYFFEDWFPSFRELKVLVMRLLGPSSVGTAMVLSLITAAGEELLFRGAIQPFAGLFFTSLLFGLLHMGKDGIFSAWSMWAFLAGLLLGWMFSATASLWPCLVAHFGVNCVSILNLRRSYRVWSELSQEAPVSKAITGRQVSHSNDSVE